MIVSEVVDSICNEFNIVDRERVYEIIAKKKKRRPKTIEEAAQSICKRHKINLDQLYAKSPKECYEKGQSRLRVYVDARMDLAKYGRFTLKASVLELGKFIGVDHTTITHYTRHRKLKNPTLVKKEQKVPPVIELEEKPVVPFVRPPAIYTNRTSVYNYD